METILAAHCAFYSPSLVLANDLTEAGSSQFALWVAFFEIYNECVYDLLQPSMCTRSKKRAALRVCDDGAGNAYVKGMNRTPCSGIALISALRFTLPKRLKIKELLERV